MDRKKFARELDDISCLLDQLSHRVERLANMADPYLATPRKKPEPHYYEDSHDTTETPR